MAEQTYRFTRAQLEQALRGAIEMYVEFRVAHGRSDEDARLYGAGEILDGLDADRELAASDPTERLKLQLPDGREKTQAACEVVFREAAHNGLGINSYAARLLIAVIAEARGLPAGTTAEQLRQVLDGVLVWRGDYWEMPPGN